MTVSTPKSPTLIYSSDSHTLGFSTQNFQFTLSQLPKRTEAQIRDYRRRLGDVIWNLRTKNGLTQEQAAEAAGVTREYFGLVERGKKNISLDTVLQICAVLAISPAELLAQAEQEAQ